MQSLAIAGRSIAELSEKDVLKTVQLSSVTITQLVFYCAAAGVTDPIHYDRDFARRSGFPDIIVNGSLRVAWLAQAFVGLAARPARLARLKCNHRGSILVGQSPTIELRYIRSLTVSDGSSEVMCEASSSVDGKVADTAEGTFVFPPNGSQGEPTTAQRGELP